MINEQIRDREVRLIGEDGQLIGIMSSRDAFKMAQDAGLDLVKIAPKAQPPVCKIVDYGKYRYEQARKEKEAKKKQKTMEVKEVRLSPNIDSNDLNTKINQARKFLEHGDKVKVTLRFRGRELAHVEQSKVILDNFAEKLAEIAVVTRVMAADLGKEGIRVNAISAGPIRTLAASGIKNFKKMLATFEKTAALRRTVTIEDVGNSAAFLCSDLASGITGEIVHVDAGFSITAMGELGEE